MLSFSAYASYFQHASSSGSFLTGALLFGVVFCLALLAEAIRTFTEIWVTFWTSTDEKEIVTQSDLAFWLVGYGCTLAVRSRPQTWMERERERERERWYSSEWNQPYTESGFMIFMFLYTNGMGIPWSQHVSTTIANRWFNLADEHPGTW